MKNIKEFKINHNILFVIIVRKKCNPIDQKFPCLVTYYMLPITSQGRSICGEAVSQAIHQSTVRQQYRSPSPKTSHTRTPFILRQSAQNRAITGHPIIKQFVYKFLRNNQQTRNAAIFVCVVFVVVVAGHMQCKQVFLPLPSYVWNVSTFTSLTSDVIQNKHFSPPSCVYLCIVTKALSESKSREECFSPHKYKKKRCISLPSAVLVPRESISNSKHSQTRTTTVQLHRFALVFVNGKRLSLSLRTAFSHASSASSVRLAAALANTNKHSRWALRSQDPFRSRRVEHNKKHCHIFCILFL